MKMYNIYRCIIYRHFTENANYGEACATTQTHKQQNFEIPVQYLCVKL